MPPITTIACLLACGASAAESQPKATATRSAVEVARRIETGRRALVRMHEKSLTSPHWVRRCFGVQALGDVRHPAATDRLIAMLNDADRRVLAIVLLELMVRRAEVPPGAAEALGKAVPRLVEGDAGQRMLLLALLAAERLPVGPEVYRPVWKRGYRRMRKPHVQTELANALVNLIRTRADTTLVDGVVRRTKRTRSKRTRDTEFLGGLFDAEPGRGRTWMQWWNQRRLDCRFERPVRTEFADAIDAYIRTQREKPDLEHGTREYYEQFEVYLGALHAAGLDVVFVFDSTGSMQSLIHQVKQNIGVMAELLANVTGETRISLVTYRDTTDADTSYVTRRTPLTGRVEALEKWIGRIRARGGGDAPEAVLAGIQAAVQKSRWHTGSKRIITLIGDAPPHPEDRPKLKTLCTAARKEGYVINTIALVHEGARLETLHEKPAGADAVDLLALGTRLTFEEIAAWGGGQAVVQDDIAQVVADMLKTAFRPEWKDRIDRFVEAYLLLTSPSDLSGKPRSDRPRKPSRIRRRLLGVP